MSTNEQPEEMRRSGGLRDLVPADWPYARGEGCLAVRCYRAVVEKRESVPDLMTFDVPDARLVLLWGSISYINASPVQVTSWLREKVNIAVKCAVDERTPDGAHLLVLCPVADTSFGDDTKFALEAAVAVAMLVLGENIAHSKVCEFVQGSDGRPKATVATFRLPILFPETGLPATAEPLRDLGQALRGARASDKPRLSRALRWLADGMAKDGADGVVAMWIAIETLAMEDTTNIRPINERLARVYGLAYDDAARRFLVGRLQNLRSNIIHRGFTAHVTPNVTRYLRALFMTASCAT